MTRKSCAVGMRNAILRNYLNQFFTSIGEITNEKIKQLANECGYAPVQPTVSPEFPSAEQFTFTSVHCQDIEKTVSSLATNKVPGIDKLPARVIKDSAPVIIPSITSITRRIFAFTRALCWGETLVLLHVVLQGIFCNGLSCNCFCIGMLKMQGYYLCIQVENIVVM